MFTSLLDSNLKNKQTCNLIPIKVDLVCADARQGYILLNRPVIMKGHKKRKRSFFTKGHEYYAARADRKKPETVLPQPSTSAATLGLETVNQGETSATPPGRRHGILGTKKIRKRLRRRPLKNTTLSTSGNRIINITKMVDMMNSLYKRHRIRNSIQTNCQRLNVAVVKEVKQGLAWQYQFRCKSCAFVSDMYRLYQVIPKRTQCKISQPRKFHTAAINLALSVVLTHQLEITRSV